MEARVVIAVAYTANWLPIVLLFAAILIVFALALVTAAKTPTPLAPVARGGTLRTRTVGRGESPRPQPHSPRGGSTLRAVGVVPKPANRGSARRLPAGERQPHGSAH